MAEDEATLPWQRAIEEISPSMLAAQSAWLGAIDSLTGLDRKTHHLVRMACIAILRKQEGVERHAQLAGEAGATWDEVATTLALTMPAFGMLPMTDGMEAARRGWEASQQADA